MREPRGSLVNAKKRRATLYLTAEANSLCSEPRTAGASSGVSGTTRLEGFMAELGRPVEPKRLVYKSRRRNDKPALRESDKPILAETPRTTEPWVAKGLDLDGGVCKEGRTEDWR